MNLQRGTALWQVSCLALVVVTVIACIALSLGGRSFGLPVVAIWLALAVITIVTMLASLRLASGEGATEAALEDIPSAPAAPGTKFHEWLVDRMGEHGMTTMQVAIGLEVREDVVEDWLAGRQVPTPVECTRIAQLFEVPERNVLVAAGWT